MTINAINGKAFTGLSAVDGKAVSALSHVDGFPLESGGGPVGGYVLWLKADAIVGLSDGDPVGTWADSSGNGNDATQSTGANKPKYQIFGQNALPTVTFDGGDFLDLVSSVATGACTVFVVLHSTDRASFDARPIMGVQSSSSNEFILRWDIAGNAPFTLGGISSNNTSVTTWHQMNVTKAGGGSSQTINYRIDEASGGTGSGGATSTGANRVGNTAGSSGFKGQISEIIVYPSVLSGGNILTVEAYLETKYVLTAFSPLQISGITEWVSVQNIDWYSLANNTAVGTTYKWDKPYLSYLTGFEQASGSDQPLIKTGGPNSLPYLSFDTSDSLTQGNGSSNFLSGSAWTQFIVIRPQTTGGGVCTEGGQTVYTTNGYVGIDLLDVGGGNSKFCFQDYDGSYHNVQSTTNYSTSTWYIVVCWFASGTLHIQVSNDTEVTGSGGGGPSSLANASKIGGGSGASFMAERVTYNVDIGSTDRANVYSYLSTKYAI